MPVLIAIILSIDLIFFESLVSSLLNFDIFFTLIIGIAISTIFNKRTGVVIIITWCIFWDLTYFPVLPITTISIMLAWLIWNKFIKSKLVAGNLSVLLLIAGSWLVLFYIFYWIMSWLSYLFQYSLIFPDFTRIYIYLFSVSINLVIMSLLIFLIKRLSPSFIHR
ncbi:MAG: hypothetical protein WC575_03120 [Patescibacteria group bacterium]